MEPEGPVTSISTSTASRESLARLARLAVTLLGTAAFCAWIRDWQQPLDPLYDLPAALAVFSFVGQLLAEGLTGRRTNAWLFRIAAVLDGTLIIVIFKEYLGWTISGHVTMVLLVAMLQTADRRLPAWLRACYWVPLPIVAAMRIFVLHGGVETGLTTGLIVGGALGALTLLLIRSNPTLAPEPMTTPTPSDD
jgi:hypothetical protein